MSIDEQIQKACVFLKQQGSKKVFLFGSRLSGNSRPESDIDLGVQGLPPEKFFSAYSALDEIVTAPVDLTDFDAQPRLFATLSQLGELEEIV